MDSDTTVGNSVETLERKTKSGEVMDKAEVSNGFFHEVFVYSVNEFIPQ